MGHIAFNLTSIKGQKLTKVSNDIVMVTQVDSNLSIRFLDGSTGLFTNPLNDLMHAPNIFPIILDNYLGAVNASHIKVCQETPDNYTQIFFKAYTKLGSIISKQTQDETIVSINGESEATYLMLIPIVELNTANRHNHVNKIILDKFGEDLLGLPTYNGNSVDTTVAQRDVYDGLDSSDNTISLSANNGKVLRDVQIDQQTAIDLNTAKVLIPAIRTTSVSTVFTASDRTIVSEGGTTTSTLPTAIGIEGKEYILRNEADTVTSKFIFFSGSGAITQVGSSVITGDIGSKSGVISGFGTSTINGTTHFNDATTIAEELAVQTKYNQLVALPSVSHVAVLGNGEILSPGVYSIAAAGSTALTLTLDGGGDPNAFFVMKFGGALTTGAGTNIVLKNGASANNVYWVTAAAVTMGATTNFQGNVITTAGAITMPVTSTLIGRFLSVSGAINITTSTLLTVPSGIARPIVNPTKTLDTTSSQTISKLNAINVPFRDIVTVQSDGTNWVLL